MSNLHRQHELTLEQIRSVADVLPGMVAYWDRDLRNVLANRAAGDHFGKTPEQVLGRHLSEVLSPEAYALNLSHARAALSGERQDFDSSMIDHRRQLRHLHVTYIPDRAGDEIRGFSVLIMDVTEQRNHQLRLADEARRLREAQILGRVGSWEFDLATGRRIWSDGLFALFGVEPGVDADEVAFSCLSPASRYEIQAVLDGCVQSRQPVTLRYEIKRKSDGQHRVLEGHAQPVIVNDAVIALRGSLTDVSEHVAAEQHRLEALAAQQQAAHIGRRYHALLESTVEGIVIQATDGSIVTANPAACAILGLNTDEITGRTSTDPRWRAVDEEGEPFPGDRHPSMVTLRTGLAVKDVTFGIVTPEGDLRWLHVDTAPLFDELGEVEGVITGFADVTEQRRADQLLAETRNLFAGVLDAALEQSIIAVDLDGQITVFNVGAHRMLGYSPAEMLGRSPEVIHDEAEVLARAAELGIAPGFAVFVEPISRGQHSDTRQWTYLTKDGHRLQVMLSVSAMRDGAGAVNGYIGVATNVTQLRQAEGALADGEALFRLAFDTAPSGMAMLGLAGQITRTNPALQAITGRSEAELLQLRLADIAHPDNADQVVSLLAELDLDHAEAIRSEFRFSDRDGSPVWGQVGFSRIPPHPGAAPVTICLVEDVTARKEAEEALLHRSLHDPLTGLASRTLLRDRIEHALAASARSHVPIGVLYIDLDGFKAVNDTAGHAAGDELLVQVAQRLSRAVRPGDTVARIGGDEFAVVCIDVASSEALALAATRILTALRAPFRLQAGIHQISGSIGIQLSDSASRPDQLMADSDAAMYRAKTDGKNRIARPRLADQARAARAARLGPELQTALVQDQLVMFGQPVVDLAIGAVVAVETLIRWHHPSRGLLPPSEFLDVAERSPLMVALGQRVLRESCRMAAAWCELLGPAAPDVHVNISGRQLETGQLSLDVLSALETYSLPASRLILELTETHMPAIADSLRTDLNNLRDRGVRIAIDDLGTGYSSLTRITELPVDMLKIDLRFIAGLGVDPSCQAIVRAVLSLGQEMGLSVVAEGVETPQQAAILAGYGCDTVQGYLYSAPRPEAELVRYLTTATQHPRA